jgi:hypothetical protein
MFVINEGFLAILEDWQCLIADKRNLPNPSKLTMKFNYNYKGVVNIT